MGKNRKPYTIGELIEVSSRYDDLKEFRTKEKRAYCAMQRRGLLEQLCAHMKRYWDNYTESELSAIAAKYDDLKMFRKKEANAYDAILRRGLTDVLCGHMKRRATRRTDEELAAIASKYNSLPEFREQETAVYVAISHRGFVDKLCSHMERLNKRSCSEEELAAIASKYDTMQDFRREENSAYRTIVERGLLDKLCRHMKRRFKTEEEIAEICRRYDNLKEFRKKEHNLYNSILDRGLVDKMCGHMERTGNLFKRKVYVFTFSDGYAYVGLTQDPKYRYKQHVEEAIKSPVYRHIQETGASHEFKILTGWIDKKDVGKVEESYIERYANDGWKMLNKAKGGGLGCGIQYDYTHEKIQSEANKYRYLEDFRKYSKRYYEFVRIHNLFDEYCSHMERRYRKHGYWNLENCIKAAKECKSRSELQKRYRRAYKVLYEANLLDRYVPPLRKRKSKNPTSVCESDS
jgi:hypothetical protein